MKSLILTVGLLTSLSSFAQSDYCKIVPTLINDAKAKAYNQAENGVAGAKERAFTLANISEDVKIACEEQDLEIALSKSYCQIVPRLISDAKAKAYNQAENGIAGAKERAFALSNISEDVKIACEE